MRDLPDRIVVGANGAYWRDYGDHYSMCPVSEDNDPVVSVAVYVRVAARADPVARLDVARLSQAMALAGYADPHPDWRWVQPLEGAEAIAREYAALSRSNPR